MSDEHPVDDGFCFGGLAVDTKGNALFVALVRDLHRINSDMSPPATHWFRQPDQKPPCRQVLPADRKAVVTLFVER